MSVKVEKTIIRYSNSFKLMIVHELEEGSSFEAVRKRYGIGGAATIQKWVKKYGKHHLLNKTIRVETMNERDRLKELEAENKKLKVKLAETYLAKDCLEELINMANKIYKTDIKKNFGTQSVTSSKSDIK